MSNGEGANGNGLSDPGQLVRREDLIDELVLTWDRMTCRLNIGGRISSIDAALAMLAQAKRVFETQQRMQTVAAIKAQAEEQQRVQEIMARTRGGRGV